MSKNKKRKLFSKKIDDVIAKVAEDSITPPKLEDVPPFAKILIFALTAKSGPKLKKKPSPPQFLYVKCPSCGQVHHKLTDSFDSSLPPHSGMLELLEVYEELGWERPPIDTTLGYGALRCSGCEAPLCPSGRFKIVPLDYKELKNVISNQL